MSNDNGLSFRYSLSLYHRRMCSSISLYFIIIQNPSQCISHVCNDSSLLCSNGFCASQHGCADFQNLNVVVVVIVELIMSIQVYHSVRKYPRSLSLEGFPYSAPRSLPIYVQISLVQFILSIVQWLWTVLKDTHSVVMAPVLQVLVYIWILVHLHDLSDVRMGRVCCRLRIASRIGNVC